MRCKPDSPTRATLPTISTGLLDWQNEKCVMVIDESLPLGIIEFPVPILRGSPEIIKQIREKLYQPDFQDLTVVDFSDLAQGCKTYDEFIEKMWHTPQSTLQYLGVAMCGPKKKVNKLTGSMPLLR